MARKVIDHENISHKDVVIALHKSYARSFPGNKDHFNDVWEIEDDFENTSLKKWWTHQKVPRFIRFILSLIDEWRIAFWIRKKFRFQSFIIYVPQDKVKWIRHAIFLENCMGYNYLEEGTGAYVQKYFGQARKFNTSFFTRLLMPEAALFSSENFYNTYPKFNKAFALSDLAFPKISSKTTFKSAIVSSQSSLDAPLFVFDNLSNYLNSNNISIELYEKLIEAIPNDRIYLKFHPRQEDSERGFLMSSLSKRMVKYEVIPDTTIIESLFMEKRINLIGVVSSLLIYNRLLGTGSSKSYLKFALPHIDQSRVNAFYETLRLYEKLGITTINPEP